MCMFCRSLFVLLYFFFCVVYSSSIYGFWLPLWYLQTLTEYVWFQLLKWRKKYHTVGTALKFNRKTAEIDKIDTINTHIHDRLLDAGGVKLVLPAQASSLGKMLLSCKCFPHFSKISTGWTVLLEERHNLEHYTKYKMFSTK